VRLDHIVVGPNARVEGQVVRNDNAPRANVRLTFVSTDRRAPRAIADANSAGRFQLTLESGGWMVFINGPDGTPLYNGRIEIGGSQAQRITLVSR
jgi:hypothetical protein